MKHLARVADPSQAVVFIHVFDRATGGWDVQQRYFRRIPIAGEYFAFDGHGGWFEVRYVVHCPFPEADCDAEIYGIAADASAVQRTMTRVE